MFDPRAVASYGVGFGVILGLGDDAAAGALAVGDALAGAGGGGVIPGEALAAGDADGVGFMILTAADATSFHSPLRRANVSIQRYSPLMSTDLPAAFLYFPPFTMLRPLATAASASSTVTLISATSHESADRLPLPISLMS